MSILDKLSYNVVGLVGGSEELNKIMSEFNSLRFAEWSIMAIIIITSLSSVLTIYYMTKKGDLDASDGSYEVKYKEMKFKGMFWLITLILSTLTSFFFAAHYVSVKGDYETAVLTYKDSIEEKGTDDVVLLGELEVTEEGSYIDVTFLKDDLIVKERAAINIKEGKKGLTLKYKELDPGVIEEYDIDIGKENELFAVTLEMSYEEYNKKFGKDSD